MALTTTREYRWDDAGAPVLNGLAGSFYALAKACFVGTGGVAYGTGADEKPAAGWSLPWDDPVGFKAVFRNSMAHGGSGCYVRVLDDGSSAGGPRVARIDVYESMTDIDTGINPAAGGWIWKAQTATADPRAYTLHADERTFYATTYVGGDVVPLTTGVNMGNLCCAIGAGDYDAVIPGDPGVFAALTESENPGTGANARIPSPIGAGRSSGTLVGSSDFFCVSRNPELVADPTRATVLALGTTPGGNISASGGNQSLLPDPGPGGTYLITPAHFLAGAYRGRLRGLYLINNSTTSTGGIHVGTTHSVMGGAGPIALAALAGNVAATSNVNQVVRMLVDRSGSWDQ